MNGTSALSGFEGRDVRSLIDARATLRGAHPFLIWQPFDAPARTWSYAGFRYAVRRFAAGLHARGLRPGQRLLIHSDNCAAPVRLVLHGAVLRRALSGHPVPQAHHFRHFGGPVCDPP